MRSMLLPGVVHFLPLIGFGSSMDLAMSLGPYGMPDGGPLNPARSMPPITRVGPESEPERIESGRTTACA